MNREEAIHILDNLKPTNTKSSFDAYVVGQAITMAIKVLEQEPTTKNNLGVEEVTALAEWTEKLTKECEEAYKKGYEAGRKELEPITSKDKFIYALTACGCLLKDGKTWYEHNELIKCFEDLGLFEQEPILDKIRAEIKQLRLIGYATIDGKREIASRAVLEILDKYRTESEEV